VTLEEIDSAESFVQNLEKIELPNQLVAVLADPLLQKLMTLRASSDEASSRIMNWVESCVMDARNGDAGPELLLDIVQVLQDYVSNTQVQITYRLA
jgi:centromere protein I